MSELDESIQQERERELVRRLGVAEADIKATRAELARSYERTGELEKLLEKAIRRANHYEAVFQEARDNEYKCAGNSKKLASALEQVGQLVKILDSEKLVELVNVAKGMPERSWYEEFSP